MRKTSDKWCYNHNDYLPCSEFDLIKSHKPQLCKKCQQEVNKRAAKSRGKLTQVEYNEKSRKEDLRANPAKVNRRRKIEDILIEQKDKMDHEL